MKSNQGLEFTIGTPKALRSSSPMCTSAVISTYMNHVERKPIREVQLKASKTDFMLGKIDFLTSSA